MMPVEPLPLHHSWPLFDRHARFDLGADWPLLVAARLAPPDAAVGRWSCDLADDALSWSDAVYDLFGLPRGIAVPRAEAVRRYEEGSRAAMERLRGYAIRHHRGFTLDVLLRPSGAVRRRVRLVAMPVYAGARAIRLEGLKCAVDDE